MKIPPTPGISFVSPKIGIVYIMIIVLSDYLYDDINDYIFGVGINS